MIRPLRVGLVLLSALLCYGTAWARSQDAGLLAEPGNYSFLPDGSKPSGVARVTYGSRNLSAASIRMDSGLIGNTGMRAFVALEDAHGPDLPHSPGAKAGVIVHGTAIGLQKVFLDSTTMSLEGDWQHDNLPAGGFYPGRLGHRLIRSQPDAD
jgi:hypothetical protein